MPDITNSTARTLREMTGLLAGERLSVMSAFDAVGDGLSATDGAITATDTTFVSASAAFVAGDVGKVINIHGAGAVGSGDWLRTTIASVTSATTVELAAAAANTVSGAYYEYGTDDAPAVRTALETLRDIYIPKPFRGSFYLINSMGPETTDYKTGNERFCLALFDNQRLISDQGAELRLGGGAVDLSATGVGMFLLADRSNVEVRGLTLEMQGNRNTNGGFCQGFLAIDGADILIDGVTIRDCPGRNSINFGGGGAHVNQEDCGQRRRAHNCIIINGGTTLTANTAQTDFSAIYTDGQFDEVVNCSIRHDAYPTTNCGGIEVHNSYCRVERNYVEKSYPGIWLGTEFANEELTDLTLVGNTFHQCVIAVALTSNATGTADFRRLRMSGNTFRTIQFPSPLDSLESAALLQPRDDTGVFTVTTRIYDSEWTDNTVIDLDASPATGRTNGVKVSAVDGLVCNGNRYINMGGAAMIVRGSPYDVRNLSIENNTVIDWGSNIGAFGHWCFYFDFTGSSTTPVKAAYDADNIVLRNNTCILSADSGSHFITYFDWDAGSSITNLTTSDMHVFRCTNLKAGAKASSVTFYGALRNTLQSEDNLLNPHIQTDGYIRVGTAATLARYRFFEDDTGQGASIISTSGFSSTYNGICFANNEDSDGVQSDATLASHRYMVGGYDSVTHPGTDDAFSWARLPAAGNPATDWDTLARLRSNSNLDLYDGMFAVRKSGNTPGQLYGMLRLGPDNVTYEDEGGEVRAYQGDGIDESEVTIATARSGDNNSTNKFRVGRYGDVTVYNESTGIQAYSRLKIRKNANQGSNNLFEVLDTDGTTILGKWTSSGTFSASFDTITVASGYGTVGTNNKLVIGAGGSTPNAASFSWGDGGGWYFNLGTNLSGVYTPIIRIIDSGVLQLLNSTTIKFDAATASRIAKFDASKNLTTGKVSVTNADDVDVSSLTDLALVRRNGTALGSLAISGTGFISVSSGVVGTTAQKVRLDNQDDVTHTLNQGNVCVIGSFGTLTEITDANLAAQIGSEMATELLGNSGFISGLQTALQAGMAAYVVANVNVSITDPTHGHTITDPDTADPTNTGVTASLV